MNRTKDKDHQIVVDIETADGVEQVYQTIKAENTEQAQNKAEVIADNLHNQDRVESVTEITTYNTDKGIDSLREEYMKMTGEWLPEKAQANNWVIRFDHCFQRVVLDNLFNDCWYNHLDKESDVPAYKQLTEEQLIEAIQIATEMYNQGRKEVEYRNNQSLEWRDKKKALS